jgi:hypothetical protein
MKNMFNKIILGVLTAALVFAAFPVTGVSAQGENPPQTPALTNDKLEKVWERELQAYERLGKVFNDIDDTLTIFQARINRAAKNGKDVTSLQSALDAFAAALKKSKPIYDGMGQLVSSHAGFDASGKVTDAEQAKSTAKAMGDKLKELKESMGGTGKALREAVKDFREANKPVAVPTKQDS